MLPDNFIWKTAGIYRYRLFDMPEDRIYLGIIGVNQFCVSQEKVLVYKLDIGKKRGHAHFRLHFSGSQYRSSQVRLTIQFMESIREDISVETSGSGQ
ncbi:hypothetical protein CI610_00696 [invertebrate metagenome]|uniref:Uncharacterized protein n=1 Tax=invertebrate metagenome TaxID=1711999 RepID=A0A2H9TAU7_9ZZZZ